MIKTSVFPVWPILIWVFYEKEVNSKKITLKLMLTLAHWLFVPQHHFEILIYAYTPSRALRLTDQSLLVGPQISEEAQCGSNWQADSLFLFKSL